MGEYGISDMELSFHIKKNIQKIVASYAFNCSSITAILFVYATPQRMQKEQGSILSEHLLGESLGESVIMHAEISNDQLADNYLQQLLNFQNIKNIRKLKVVHEDSKHVSTLYVHQM